MEASSMGSGVKYAQGKANPNTPKPSSGFASQSLVGGLFSNAMSQSKAASTASSGTLGANKSATNRAMGMQSKGGQQAQQAASGNVGVVSQGMVNAEIQNDDVLDPTKLMGL